MLALTREGQHSRRVQPSAVAGCDQRGILTLSARVCWCLLAELFFLSGVHHLYECMAVIRVERCCTSSSHAPALRTTGYLVIGSGGALLKSKDQEGRPGGSRDGADHVSYPRSLSLDGADHVSYPRLRWSRPRAKGGRSTRALRGLDHRNPCRKAWSGPP